MGKVIDVMSLYPKDMNIYGDSGNVLVVLRRLALYGYEPRLHAYNQGDEWPERVDMILGGGGQDTGQKKITGDLFKRVGRLRDLAADGTPMLMICGLFSCSANTSRPRKASGWTASTCSARTRWGRATG